MHCDLHKRKLHKSQIPCVALQSLNIPFLFRFNRSGQTYKCRIRFIDILNQNFIKWHVAANCVITMSRARLKLLRKTEPKINIFSATSLSFVRILKVVMFRL